MKDLSDIIALEASVAATLSGNTEADVHMLSSSAVGSSQKDQLATCLLALKCLELDASSQALHLSKSTRHEMSRLHELAFGLLNAGAAALANTASLYIKGKYYVVRALYAFNDGEPLESLHFLECANRFALEKYSTDEPWVLFVEGAIRYQLGQLAAAQYLLLQAEETSLDSGLWIQARLLRLQCLRLMGLEDHYETVAKDSLNRCPESHDLRWEIVANQATISNGLKAAIEITKKTRPLRCPVRLLYLAFASKAVAKDAWRHAMPKARGILELQLKTQKKVPIDWKTLTQTFSHLEKSSDDESLTPDRRILELGKALNLAQRIIDPQWRLLAIAACARSYLGINAVELAKIAAREYENLCRSLSDGRNGDLLKMAFAETNIAALAVTDQNVTLLTEASFTHSHRAIRIGAYLARVAGISVRHLVTKKGQGVDDRESYQSALQQVLKDFAAEAKGIAMKVGQLLSIYSPLIHEDFSTSLDDLQKAPKFLSPIAIKRVFTKATGRKVKDEFDWFEDEPIASASIGQVHRGKLKDGAVVAVKIQHPNISQQIKSQLAVARLLGVFFRSRFPQVNMKEFLNEVHSILNVELDYRVELENHQAFRIANSNPNIVIPAIYERESTQHVLVTEFISGQTMQHFLQTASKDEINQSAKTIHDFLIHSAYGSHLAYCDPHPGNFLFLGDGRVAIVDFGYCVKLPQPGFDHHLRSFAAARNDDIEMFRALLIDDKIIVDPNADIDELFAAVKIGFAPWLSDGLYKFDANQMSAQSRIAAAASDKVKYPAGFLSMFRFVQGMVSTLSLMGCEIDCSRGLQQYLQPKALQTA